MKTFEKIKVHGLWVHQVTRELMVATYEDIGIASLWQTNGPSESSQEWDFWAELPGQLRAGRWRDEYEGVFGGVRG